MFCKTITNSTLLSSVVFKKDSLSFVFVIDRSGREDLLVVASDWCISNLTHGWWILIRSIVSVRICSCSERCGAITLLHSLLMLVG